MVYCYAACARVFSDFLYLLMMLRHYQSIGHPISHDAAHNPALQALHKAETELLALRNEALSTRAAKSRERLQALGRLSVDERFAMLFDKGTKHLPLMSLAQGSANAESKSAGVYVAIGQIHGLYCIVIANDNCQSAGAWFERTPPKITRAQQSALKLRIPTVYLVECSGLYLPLAHEAFGGAHGAGAIFKFQARLMHAGIVQLAAVFGDCIAGGGYMPIMTDYVVMTEAANILIGGSAIAQGAKGVQLDARCVGGPNMHVHQSHCADERAPDDACAIAMLREQMAKLGSSNAPFYRKFTQDPVFDARECYQLLSRPASENIDVREILARCLDASLASEILPNFGQEIYACVGTVQGLSLVFIANSGRNTTTASGKLKAGSLLYRDGILKMQRIVRACAQDGLPIVWIQDVAGFDVGAEAESHGLLALGANLLYENTNNPAPQMTLILRKASGAGYYAMGGLPFEPAMQISTILAQQTVMAPQTLTQAVYSKRQQNAAQRNDMPGLMKIEEEMTDLCATAEQNASPVRNAQRLYTDEIVCLNEIPLYLRAFAEMSYQGCMRRRPERLWRLNDEEAQE